MAAHPAHDHALDHEHERLGLSGRALTSELKLAEARCAADGQKLTPSRHRVLQLLMQAGHPVKAYDLIAAYGQGDEGPAKPPTVYRALEFLERQGLAHRIESLAAYMACRRGDGSHAAAFLICDCCGRTDEVEAPVAEALKQVAADSGYALQSVAIEAHGRCAACRV